MREKASKKQSIAQNNNEQNGAEASTGIKAALPDLMIKLGVKHLKKYIGEHPVGGRFDQSQNAVYTLLDELIDINKGRLTGEKGESVNARSAKRIAAYLARTTASTFVGYGASLWQAGSIAASNIMDSTVNSTPVTSLATYASSTVQVSTAILGGTIPALRGVMGAIIGNSTAYDTALQTVRYDAKTSETEVTKARAA